MDLQYENFKLEYIKYCVNASVYPQEELIMPSVSLPDENDAHDNAVIRGYILLSRWKPKDNMHMKILTSYDKLLKKNQEDGMKLSPRKFANILYVLHRYCVRLLKNPWRKEFYVIKDYNGFYQYTLARYLSQAVIKALLGLVGFVYDERTHTFSLQWPSMDVEVTNYVLNAGIGFFLSYIHCRARNDANFKERVKGLTYLLQRPSSRDGEAGAHRTTPEQREYDARENPNATSSRRNIDLQQPSKPKAGSLERSYNVETSDIFRSAMPFPSAGNARTLASRHHRDQHASGRDYDLYGSGSEDIYRTDDAMSGSSRGSPKRSTTTSSPLKYSHKLDSKMRNVQMNDVAMGRSSSDKRQTRSDPNVSSSYVQFIPMDHSVLGRGTPDGGIDVDKDYVERRYPQSDHHIYHHIK